MTDENSNPIQVNATVLQHEKTAENAMTLVLDAPDIARACVPGQFVHVLCVDPARSQDPLLRRPISIHDADSESGRISVLYEIRGRGTALLTERIPGEQVGLLGPLGTGFHIPESGCRPIILVGGGVGAAPLSFLAHTISSRFGPECMTFFMGARSVAGHVCYDAFHNLCREPVGGERYCVCTDDGSGGFHGLVTEPLLGWLRDHSMGERPLIYACGPTPMLRAVARIAREHGAECQVSLEAKMACGVGACMSCVIKVCDGESWKYVRCCKEGPVFDANEVIWE